MKLSLAAATVLIALLLYLCVSHIPDGSVGIVESGGTTKALLSGFHLHLPFSGPSVIYPTSLPPASGETRITLADGAAFAIGFEISGRLDPRQATIFHQTAARRGAEELLRTAGALGLQETAPARTAADVASGAFETEAAERAGRYLAPYGAAEVALRLRLSSPATLLALAQALAPSRQAGLLGLLVGDALAKDASTWEIHAAMGLVKESEKDPRGAEKHYLDALTINPTALPPMAHLAAIYTAVGEAPKLDRLLAAALQAQPNSIQHLNWMAVSLMMQNRLEEAEKAIERALAVEPANLLLLNNLGGMQLKRGRFDDAALTFRRALQQDPNDSQSLYNLGIALSAQGRYADGLEHLLAAERAGPAGEPLLRAIATTYRALGRTRKASEYEGRLRSLKTPAPAS